MERVCQRREWFDRIQVENSRWQIKQSVEMEIKLGLAKETTAVLKVNWL